MAANGNRQNQISQAPGTIGVREMPDGLDSGYCHIRHNVSGNGSPAVIRVNLGGIWCSLCQECLDHLNACLASPLLAPERTR